jgi:MYXO-CTERM domain-containing protein
MIALLTKRCGPCHVGETPIADLRVDDSKALHRGGFTGPPFVAGDPGASLLYHRVVLPKEDDEHMPPVSAPALTPGEIELIGMWIKAGADDSEFAPNEASEAARVAIADVLPASKFPPEPVPVPSSSPHVPPETHGGGCAGCSMGGVTGGALPIAALAALALALAGRKRPR